MVKSTIECVVCRKKDKFADAKDITQSHWRILGWNVGENVPVCVCDKCEYIVPKVAKTPITTPS